MYFLQISQRAKKFIAVELDPPKNADTTKTYGNSKLF